MTVRLNKSFCEKIAENYARATYSAPLEASQRLVEQRARELYSSIVSERARHSLEQAATMIDELLTGYGNDGNRPIISHHSVIIVRLSRGAGDAFRAKFPGGASLPGPAWGAFDVGGDVAPGVWPELDAARHAIKAHLDLLAERGDRRDELIAALRGLRTLADLEREWPEGKEHYAFLYPPAIADDPIQVPARVDPFAIFRPSNAE